MINLLILVQLLLANQYSLREYLQAEGSSTPSAGGKKSRVTRKHVIIGVTGALIVAMVITGVLVGVKLYLDSANELVTVSSKIFCLCCYF